MKFNELKQRAGSYLRFFYSQIHQPPSAPNANQSSLESSSKVSSKTLFFALLALGALTAYLAYSFFFNFDTTDDGFYLQLLTTGTQSIFASPYHVIVHDIGSLFNHELLGYRFLTLITLLIAGIALVSSSLAFFNIKSNLKQKIILYSMVGTFSYFYFNLLPTFSYNTLALLAGSFWLAGIFLLLSKTGTANSLMSVLLISSSFVLAFFARPPTGMIFIVMTPIMLFVCRKIFSIQFSWKWALAGISAGLAGVGAVVYTSWEFFSKIFKLYLSLASSSHGNMLGKYIKACVQFGGVFAVTVAFFIICVVLYKNRSTLPKKSKIQLIIINSILLVFFILLARKMRGASINILSLLIVTSIPFAYALLRFNTLYKTKQMSPTIGKKVIFWLLCLITAIVIDMGTNGNIIFYASLNMVIAALPLCFWIFFKTDHFTKKLAYSNLLIIGSFALVGFYIWHFQFVNTYRAKRPASDFTYSKSSSFLRNIKINPKLAANIDAFSDALKNVGFDRSQDKIFAYPDLPGYISATGCKAFGNSWNFTGYKGIDANNCAYLDFEPLSPTRYVYILSGHAIDSDPKDSTQKLWFGISPKLKDKLLSLIEPTENVKEFTVGKPFYHFRNEKKYQLYLKGPYQLKNKSLK